MAENQSQLDYWNSASGQKWIKFEDELDVVFGAVNEALIARAQPKFGERVIDIGCGTGATTRAFTQHLGQEGYVTAIDISEPLLSRARFRAKDVTVRTEYLLMDAQTDQIEGGPFDLATSRFGVMFFTDVIAAFQNIRSTLRPGGRLVVVGWAAMQDNPWLQVPRDGAATRLGQADKSDPNSPGPLGFQNTEHVTDLLEKAGFCEVAAERSLVTLRHSGPVETIAALASNIGPAARILKQYDGSQEDIEAIISHVSTNFQDFETPEGFKIPAWLNFFSAVNPL
ncbi:MAG: class I SAM-dependent methyltransferase [Amylibacter sp.]